MFVTSKVTVELVCKSYTWGQLWAWFIHFLFSGTVQASLNWWNASHQGLENRLTLCSILFPQSHTFFSLEDLFQKMIRNELLSQNILNLLELCVCMYICWWYSVNTFMYKTYNCTCAWAVLFTATKLSQIQFLLGCYSFKEKWNLIFNVS